MNNINSIVMPNDLTSNEEHMIREYINSLLDKVKAIISNDTIQKAISEYNVGSNDKLRIKQSREGGLPFFICNKRGGYIISM